MKLAPWNPVRITPNPIAFRCTHCGASDGPRRDMTVMGFMRKLRAFEKTHNRCAPAARRANVEYVGMPIAEIEAAIQRDPRAWVKSGRVVAIEQ